jgi:motility quorum-sensing regulator/GCU-specific mRNA interferase toxin
MNLISLGFMAVKFKPHYSLPAVQAVVADPSSQPFTATALRGGLALGLKESDMRSIVLALSRGDFHKSTTTISDHRVWQDVYHGKTADGTVLYIKITHYTGGKPPVIQFKAK